MASQVVPGKVERDRYRSFLDDEADTTHWRHGGPPTYDVVNKLFEQGRTKEWPEESLEETVQNAIKTWEMEFSHKTRLQDFKTINPEKFKLFANGREGLSAEETLRLGSYNALMKSSLPEKYKYYKAEDETFESSHEAFRVDPLRLLTSLGIGIFFEGPYMGHAPTGKMVQFYGFGTLKVDNLMKAEEVEIYYDPAELLGDLLAGKQTGDNTKTSETSQGCPFQNQS